MSMPESNFDPTGSTQQFRAFAKRAEEEKPRETRGRAVLLIGITVGVIAVVGIALLVLL